jgi:hypothetical protein
MIWYVPTLSANYLNIRDILLPLQVQSTPEHALFFWLLPGSLNNRSLLKVSTLLLKSQYIPPLESPYEVFLTLVAGDPSDDNFMVDSGISGRTLSLQTSLRFTTHRPVLDHLSRIHLESYVSRTVQYILFVAASFGYSQ